MSTDKTQFEQILDAIDGAEPDGDRHVMVQVNRSLGEAIRAANASGKKATVTLKLEIKPSIDRRVVCAAAVDAKLPRPPVGSVNLFHDAMGNLYPSDPQQMKMQFHTATGGKSGSHNPEEN